MFVPTIAQIRRPHKNTHSKTWLWWGGLIPARCRHTIGHARSRIGRDGSRVGRQPWPNSIKSTNFGQHFTACGPTSTDMVESWTSPGQICPTSSRSRSSSAELVQIWAFSDQNHGHVAEAGPKSGRLGSKSPRFGRNMARITQKRGLKPTSAGSSGPKLTNLGPTQPLHFALCRPI